MAEPWSAGQAGTNVDDAFVVDLDGFEGPLDLLLSLARADKLDLREISIGELAEQYLAYIALVHRANLRSPPNIW